MILFSAYLAFDDDANQRGPAAHIGPAFA